MRGVALVGLAVGYLLANTNGTAVRAETGPYTARLATGLSSMSEVMWQVRVTGHVPTDELLDQIGEIVVAEHEYRTVLSARFPDQAALHGFLQRLRAHGFEVVEVRRVQSTES